MFEDKTYDAILESMMEKVGDDFDKREGSVVYDMLAPAALALADAYFALDQFADLTFLDTAVEEFLSRRTKEYGVERKKAVCALRKAVSTGRLEIGDAFGHEEAVFEVEKAVSDTEYYLRCRQAGAIGNEYFGPLESIGNKEETVTLMDIVERGEEEETDENLRRRVFQKIQTPVSSGNANHYKAWAMEVAGVGNAKVIPLFDGPGTVKIMVADEEQKPASPALLEAVEKHLEQTRPIGASVTVCAPRPKEVAVAVKVVIGSEVYLEDVKISFQDALSEYLKTTAFSRNYISQAVVGGILLNIPGVVDFSELTLNGSASNLPLSGDEVAVAGKVEVSV